MGFPGTGAPRGPKSLSGTISTGRGETVTGVIPDTHTCFPSLQCAVGTMRHLQSHAFLGAASVEGQGLWKEGAEERREFLWS